MPLHPQEIEASDKHFAHTHTHEHTYSHGCGFMTSSHSHFCPYLLKSGGKKKTDRSLDERVWVKNGKKPQNSRCTNTARGPRFCSSGLPEHWVCVLGQSRHTEAQTGSAVGFGAYTWFSSQLWSFFWDLLCNVIAAAAAAVGKHIAGGFFNFFIWWKRESLEVLSLSNINCDLSLGLDVELACDWHSNKSSSIILKAAWVFCVRMCATHLLLRHSQCSKLLFQQKVWYEELIVASTWGPTFMMYRCHMNFFFIFPWSFTFKLNIPNLQLQFQDNLTLQYPSKTAGDFSSPTAATAPCDVISVPTVQRTETAATD